jgi:signal transduction histidine kinase
MRALAQDTTANSAEPFAAAQVAEGALKLIRAQLQLHGIVVQLELETSLPWCRGWPYQIEQALLILLANADAAIEDRRRPAVEGTEFLPVAWAGRIILRVASPAPGTEVLLSVADNGGGIPAGVVDRVFEPFFTTREVGHGTGLGLAIARGIVQQHRGRIEVGNRSGDGVTFTIVLPTAEVDSSGPTPVGWNGDGVGG